MSKNKEFLVLGIVLLAIILILLFLKYRREGDEWIENITILNGDAIQVFHDYSHRAIYGTLHFLIGGGGERYEVSFNYKGASYRWLCLHIPIVIQFWKNNPHIVMLDREKLSDIKFRFYKYVDRKLIEISAEDFPKSVAVQNRWSFHGDHYFRYHFPVEEYKTDPNNVEFRNSMAAKIWLRLGKGVDYNRSRYKEIDKYFLIEFKKKYIEPVWGNL